MLHEEKSGSLGAGFLYFKVMAKVAVSDHNSLIWVSARLFAMQRANFVCSPVVFVLYLALTVGLSGCGDSNPDKGINVKTTFPAKGKVLIDGKTPSELEIPPVQIKAHPVGNATKDQPPGRAGTNPDGSFEMVTYKKGDGLPAGEYKLTFKSTKVNLMSPGMAAADHLGAQYIDPESSSFTVTVSETGDIQGLELIELKKPAEPVMLEDDRE